MNREELVTRAALALSKPFFVELVNRAREKDPEHPVGKVKRVCEILELENQLAASARYAAILARDFPERFQELGGKKMCQLTLEHITGEKRLPFMWGDWECVLEVPQNQKYSRYNLINTPDWADVADPPLLTIGFKVRVHFASPHKVGELKQKMVELAKVPALVIVQGVEVQPFFGVRHPGEQFQQSGHRRGRNDTIIYSWWLEVKDKGIEAPEHPLALLEIDFIELAFDLDNGILEQDLVRLKDEEFRSSLVLTCISHWLGIPVTPAAPAA